MLAGRGDRPRSTPSAPRPRLIIPPRFEKDLLAGRSAEAQVLAGRRRQLDGGPGRGLRRQHPDASPPSAWRTSIPRRPTSCARAFSSIRSSTAAGSWCPGLTVVVMAILSILLTALTVAREWENGSMELLLSTPVQPLEIIVGKLAPYGVLGLVAVAFVYVIARLSSACLSWAIFSFSALGCLLFLVTYLAQGLLISVVTRNQQVAMQFAMLTGFLPSSCSRALSFPSPACRSFFGTSP